MKSNVGVIVVAAGKGARLAGTVEKPYVRLGGRPLVCHCLGIFQRSSLVGEIVLVVHPRRVAYCSKSLLTRYRFSKVRAVVAGGRTRQESVARGLKALGTHADIVMVHDAARPFVSERMLRDLMPWAQKGAGVTVGIPVTQTIKRVDSQGLVIETPARKTLWEIQTPQAFPRYLLVRAHRAAQKKKIQSTDDAGLVERLHAKVKVVPGAPRNLKITTKEDLLLAKLLLSHEGRA